RNRSISGLGCDGRVLTIVPKVLMCRFLGWRARFSRARAGAVSNRNVSGLGRDGWVLTIATKVLTRRLLRLRARFNRAARLETGA
ncbi:hypothetical protein ACI3PL_19385, partial [Lacticaseibacillus paracasei]